MSGDKSIARKSEYVELLGKTFLMLVAGTILGYLLLVLAFCIPAKQSSKASAIALLQAEGWYPRALIQEDSFDEYFTSTYPDVLDNFSDSMILYLATQSPKDSVWAQAVSGYNDFYGKDYNYYWHGYVALWRPLLYLFQYDEIKLLNLGCMLLVMFLLALLVYRKKGLRYSLMVLSSYLLLMPIALAQNLHYTPNFYVTFGGTLLLLYREDYFRKKNRVLLFFLGLGMLSTFFDLLTYPLCTWGIPILWWIVCGNEGSKPKDTLGKTVLSGVFWILGYGGFWFAKWILTSIVLRKNALAEALYEVFFRAGMQEDGGLSYRFSAIYANWQHYGYAVYAVVLGLWFVYFMYRIMRYGFAGTKRRYVYLLIGAASFVWYFVLANQTKGHHLFTYRNFCVAIAAFMALSLDIHVEGLLEGKRETIRKSAPWRALLLVLLGVCSVLLMTQTKSESLVLNGQAQFEVVQVENDSVFSMEFVPQNEQIRKLYVGLYSEATQGEYQIVLKDAASNEVVYSSNLGIENCTEENCQSVNVDWRLKKENPYLLCVQPVGMDAPVYSFTTLPEERIDDDSARQMQEQMRIGELSAAELDGKVLDGQMLGGVEYYCKPVGARAQIFMVMSWWMLLVSLAYGVMPGNLRVK